MLAQENGTQGRLGPRLQNEEAEDLANWDFSKFKSENRVEVKLEDM